MSKETQGGMTGGKGLLLRMRTHTYSGSLGQTEDATPELNYRHVCFRPFLFCVVLVRE